MSLSWGIGRLRQVDVGNVIGAIRDTAERMVDQDDLSLYGEERTLAVRKNAEGRLGVVLLPSSLRVKETVAGGPAAEGGIVPGMRIVSIQGAPVSSFEAYSAALGAAPTEVAVGVRVPLSPEELQQRGRLLDARSLERPSQPEATPGMVDPAPQATCSQRRSSPSPSDSSAAGTPEWVQGLDPASGRIYYFNTVTKVSSWERPPGFAEIQPAAAEPQQQRASVSPQAGAADASRRQLWEEERRRLEQEVARYREGWQAAADESKAVAERQSQQIAEQFQKLQDLHRQLVASAERERKQGEELERLRQTAAREGGAAQELLAARRRLSELEGELRLANSAAEAARAAAGGGAAEALARVEQQLREAHAALHRQRVGHEDELASRQLERDELGRRVEELAEQLRDAASATEEARSAGHAQAAELEDQLRIRAQEVEALEGQLAGLRQDDEGRDAELHAAQERARGLESLLEHFQRERDAEADRRGKQMLQAVEQAHRERDAISAELQQARAQLEAARRAAAKAGADLAAKDAVVSLLRRQLHAARAEHERLLSQRDDAALVDRRTVVALLKHVAGLGGETGHEEALGALCELLAWDRAEAEAVLLRPRGVGGGVKRLSDAWVGFLMSEGKQSARSIPELHSAERLEMLNSQLRAGELSDEEYRQLLEAEAKAAAMLREVEQAAPPAACAPRPPSQAAPPGSPPPPGAPPPPPPPPPSPLPAAGASPPVRGPSAAAGAVPDAVQWPPVLPSTRSRSSESVEAALRCDLTAAAAPTRSSPPPQ